MVLIKSVFSLIKIRINAKLIRNGVKIFSFCDVKNGYLYAFLVYDGTQQHLQIVGLKTMNMVVTLASKLLVRGFNIYFDNFYSIVPLFRYLHNIKQNVIGTTRSNRISLLLLIKKKKPYGSLKWMMATIRMNNETIDSAPILACSWWDSSVVYFMSTLH
jgi:hypothetical protein